MANDDENRNAVFFLGAGASAYARIPTVGPMTTEFIAHIKNDGSEKCKKTLDALLERLSKRYKNPDIEALLQILHRLIGYQEDDLALFTRDDSGLEKSSLKELKDRLETFIRNATVTPYNVDYLRPLLDPVWGSSPDIFSVNYDTCIEMLCRNLQRRLIDGFTPEWNPRSLERDSKEFDPLSVYLYKLHGSVLWYKSKDGSLIKIPLGVNGNSESSELPLYDGNTAAPILLYPMYKQPMESPLLDFTYILKERLESARFLVVIGYSFRDAYIRALFRDAFRMRPDLHMISIGPRSRQHYRELISLGPSFQAVFYNRVTCLPFPAERVLKDLAAQFQDFSTSIKKWQDYQALRGIGRNASCAGFVESLSKLHEPVLSDYLLEEPGTTDGMTIDAMWSTVFRNYSMAIAMNDSALLDLIWERVYDIMAMVWAMFRVDVSYHTSAWQIKCQIARPGRDGSASSLLPYGPLLEAINLSIRDIDQIKMDLDRADLNTRAMLERFKENVGPVQKYFESIFNDGFTTLEAFCVFFRAEVRGTVQEQPFREWEKRVLEAPGVDGPKLSQEISGILSAPRWPKCIGALLGEIEAINTIVRNDFKPTFESTPK